MTKYLSFILAVAIAATSFGCGGDTANTAANTAPPPPPIDPNKPSADPTAEVLLDLEKATYAAFFEGNARYFESILSDKFFTYFEGSRKGKADEVKMVADMKCDIKTWSLTEPAIVKIDNDNFALTYRSSVDGECTLGGKKQKVPTPTRAVTFWTRHDAVWQAAFHGETAIIGGTADADDKAKSEQKPNDTAKADTTAGTKAAAPADASTKDRAAAPTAGKSGDVAATAKTEPAPLTPSPNTEALAKRHMGGWEAFKARDAKWFNDNLIANVGLVDPAGGYHTGNANLAKLWTETMKCEGVTAVSFGDGFSVALSPTVEILSGKGTADGKCDGQPNGPLYQVSAYVKESDAWKLAFMFETPAK